MRAAVAGPLLTVLALGLSGCSNDTTATTEQPTCAAGEEGAASNAVILMAQSVPTATWVPCLRSALPLGWTFHHLDARDTVSVFSLDSDRDGQEELHHLPNHHREMRELRLHIRLLTVSPEPHLPPAPSPAPRSTGAARDVSPSRQRLKAGGVGANNRAGRGAGDGPGVLLPGRFFKAE